MATQAEGGSEDLEAHRQSSDFDSARSYTYVGQLLQSAY